MNVGAVIAAAGSGARMGGARKPLLELAGKTFLEHCLEQFFAVAAVQSIAVVLPEEMLSDLPPWLDDPRLQVVPGGAQRADSVRAGLNALPADIDTVVIHDAARPLVTIALIESVIDVANAGLSATTALQVTDTLHQTNDALDIVATPDRSQFWRAQTPQAFPRAVLELAYSRVEDASAATDEAGLVARAGFPVRIVAGDALNIKVTTLDDIALAEAAQARRSR